MLKKSKNDRLFLCLELQIQAIRASLEGPQSWEMMIFDRFVMPPWLQLRGKFVQHRLKEPSPSWHHVLIDFRLIFDQVVDLGRFISYKISIGFIIVLGAFRALFHMPGATYDLFGRPRAT